MFNQLGDVERCTLRSGNVRSADSWRVVLEPVTARYQGIVTRLYFWGDGAFANPEIYEFLEDERKIHGRAGYATMGRVRLTAISCLLSSCVSLPTGNDVAADIKAYAYRNLPASVSPDRSEPVPFINGSGGTTIASTDIPWRNPDGVSTGLEVDPDRGTAGAAD